MEDLELQAAFLRREGHKLFLVLDHDKGRSVFKADLLGLTLAFRPLDHESTGSLADLVKDLPDATGHGQVTIGDLQVPQSYTYDPATCERRI